MANQGRRTKSDVAAMPVVEPGWPDWADPVASERLRASLRDGRIGHAYLLAGPAGVGKAALARAFAQALCCTDIDGSDRSQPCGQCRACRNVMRGAHPDVELFNLASQAILAEKSTARASLTIETVRRLSSSAALLPLEAGHRIAIVDDAETLLEPAQQALLKTLEEPPPVVTLLLLTDEPEALLDTVRSRCHEILVRPVPEVQVKRALLGRGVEESTASDIAAMSRGAAAWAIAAASNAALLKERLAERDAAVSWLMASEYDRLVTAFKLGEQFSKRRADVIGVVQAAIQVLRERMLRAANDELPAAEPDARASPRPPLLTTSRAVAASLRCLADLEANVRPRLALEAMVMQWPNLDPSPA